MILAAIDSSIKTDIIHSYEYGMKIKEIATKVHLPTHWVRKVLISNSVSLRRLKDYKWIASENEELEILSLYKQKHGIQYIANKFAVSWNRIREILDKHKVKRWTQEEITRANSDFYGATSGFEGHQHTDITKQKMSKSQLNNKNRLLTTGAKSRYIETVIGKVQGSYEVAYLQQHMDVSGSLPSIGTAIHTPYGSYIPDFNCGDVFVEIKSEFTWKVCKGMEVNQKGIKSNIQYKKIKWVDKNVKRVIVLVYKEKEARDLFKRAIENPKIVTEDIIYKNGKYYKQSPLLAHGL